MRPLKAQDKIKLRWMNFHVELITKSWLKRLIGNPGSPGAGPVRVTDSRALCYLNLVLGFCP